MEVRQSCELRTKFRLGGTYRGHIGGTSLRALLQIYSRAHARSGDERVSSSSTAATGGCSRAPRLGGSMASMGNGLVQNQGYCTFLGISRIRIVVFWGLLTHGNYQISLQCGRQGWYKLALQKAGVS